MKRYVGFFVILFTMSAAAQQPGAAKPPSAPRAPAAPAAPTQPPPPRLPEPKGQPINIRLDVSVLDQNEAAVNQPKTLMVMLADGAIGRTRGAFEDRSISVDATPRLADGRIRLYLTVESRGHGGSSAPRDQPTLFWQNSFELMLDSGKPMLAFESADPITKRKLTIEVKATVQK